MFEGSLDELEAMPHEPSGRNDKLNRVAYRLGRFIGGGFLNEADVRHRLEMVAVAIRMDYRKDGIIGTIHSGIESGKAKPITEITLQDRYPEATELDVTFWDARPELRHVHDYALSKLVSPWAVLGVTMVRLLATVGPEIVLPDLVGDVASLNLFVGLVGPSGSGKSAAIKAAAKAVIHSPLADEDEFKEVTLGSGQGIAHAFGYNVKGVVHLHEQRSVVFKLDEIDHLKATSQQASSTLLPELRCLYMGEPLGAQYVEQIKRVPIPAHSYRAGFIVGIQPPKSEVLLRDTDGGTPQRFLWLPSTYPHEEERPPAVEPWEWKRPRGIDSQVPYAIEVCDTAKEAVYRNQVRAARGEGNPLDGHRLLTQLKVAAALAFFNGHNNVNEDDWQLAKTVMKESDRTRQQCLDEVSSKSKAANKARAEAEAEKAVTVAQRVTDETVQRVARLLMKHLERGPLKRRDLTRKLHSSHTAYFDEAVERLMNDGLVAVTEVDVNGRTVMEYRKVS